jgi:hypothetical protein
MHCADEWHLPETRRDDNISISLPCIFHYFVPRPTNAQLFHKLSYIYFYSGVVVLSVISVYFDDEAFLTSVASLHVVC